MDAHDYIQLGEVEEYLYSRVHHETPNQNQQHFHRPSSSAMQFSSPFPQQNRQIQQNRTPQQHQRPNQPRPPRYWQTKNKRNYQDHTMSEIPPLMRFPPFRDESQRYNLNNRNGYSCNVEVTFPSPRNQNKNQNRKSQNFNGGRSIGGYRDDGKTKQLLNPFSAANQAKLQRLNKMKQKKARANQIRAKLGPAPASSRLGAQPQNKKIIFEDLDDDDDDEEETNQAVKRPTSPKPSTSNQFKLPAAPINSQQKQRVVNMVDENSGSMEVSIKVSDPNFSDDDVIEIPVPAPEVVTLDDSDDESMKSVEKEPNIPGSRCLSPSNSSMMSDDFIERRDRNRLNDLNKDTFYWAGHEEDLDVTPSTEQVPAKTLSVSSSSESTAGPNDLTEANQNVGPIIRGEAVERNYSKTPTRRERSNSQHQSFSAENFTEENFMETLAELIQHDSDDEDDDEPNRENDNQQSAAQDSGSDNEEPTVRAESPEDTDVMINIVTNNPGDIRQAMPDAGDRPEPVETKGPEVGWNEEMRRFFYESWGGEDFTVAGELMNMSRDVAYWPINYEDKFPRPPPREKNRCRNCQEFTHKVQNCPLPKKRVLCFMCGEEGHREPRCPNKICLTCGAPAQVFMRNCNQCNREQQVRCSLCYSRGHSYLRCPDKWRRYHNTIEDNVELNEEVIENKREFCSVCTAKGHSAHNCLQASRVMGNFLPKNRVCSYVALYPYKPTTNNRGNLAKDHNEYDYSLISFNENFKFNWSDDVGKFSNSLYNRFRESVDLEPLGESDGGRRGLKRSADDMEDEVEIVNIDYSNISQGDQNGGNDPDDSDQDDDEDGDSDDECELVIDEKQNDESTEMAGTSRLNDSSNSEGGNLRDSFSFNDEMKKVLETREFHIDIDVNNKLPGRAPKVVFDNEGDGLQRTANTLETDVPSLRQIMADSMMHFPVESSSEVGEYIPLNKRPGPHEEKSEGKLLLTEQQAARLMDDGGIFLRQMEEKYDLMLKVVWDPIANLLTVFGTQAKQRAFMKEMEQFCKKVTLDEHQKQIEDSMQCMPKNPKKLVNFIKEHLTRLKHEHKSMRELSEAYGKMQNNMRAHEYKAADRQRKILNLILLGKFGLRGGKEAVIGMVRILDEVDKLKFKVSSTPEDIRKELNGHMSYIFTAADHGDYGALLEELEYCNKNHTWPLRRSQINNIGELRKLTQEQQPLFFEDKGDNDENDDDGLNTPDSTTAENEHEQNHQINRTPTTPRPVEDFIPLTNETVDHTTPTSSTNYQEEVLFDPRRPQDTHRYYTCVRGANSSLRAIETREIIPLNPTLTPVQGIEPLPSTSSAGIRAEIEKTPQNTNSVQVTSSDQNSPIEVLKVTDTSINLNTSEESIESIECVSSNNKVTEERVPTPTPTPSAEQSEPTTEPTSEAASETVTTPEAPISKAKELALKSLEIVNQAIILFTASNNTNAIHKLKQVQQKALEEQITESDFKSLIQIQKIVQEKLGDDK